jgi:hypothetical protein
MLEADGKCVFTLFRKHQTVIQSTYIILHSHHQCVSSVSHPLEHSVEASCGGTQIILALDSLKQEDHKFNASLGYIVRPTKACYGLL